MVSSRRVCGGELSPHPNKLTPLFFFSHYLACPSTMSKSYRCEAVVTEVEFFSKTNNTDTQDAFKIALEAAVEEGRLQEYLDTVNPESPITILKQYF